MSPIAPTAPDAATVPTSVPAQAFRFCPRCGTAANGNSYCTNSGTPLCS